MVIILMTWQFLGSDYFSQCKVKLMDTWITSVAIAGVISTHLWKHSNAWVLFPARRNAFAFFRFSCLFLKLDKKLITHRHYPYQHKKIIYCWGQGYLKQQHGGENVYCSYWSFNGASMTFISIHHLSSYHDHLNHPYISITNISYS